jgi:hypothetical protein
VYLVSSREVDLSLLEKAERGLEISVNRRRVDKVEAL